MRMFSWCSLTDCTWILKKTLTDAEGDSSRKSCKLSVQPPSPYLDKSRSLYKTKNQTQEYEPTIIPEVLAKVNTLWATFSNVIHTTVQTVRNEQCCWNKLMNFTPWSLASVPKPCRHGRILHAWMCCSKHSHFFPVAICSGSYHYRSQ